MIKFIFNGKGEKIIQCRKNDTISKVIENYELQMNFRNKSKRYIISGSLINYDEVTLIGESKRIPRNEAKYITYKIQSNYDIDNALCKIDVIDIDAVEFY